MKAARLGAPGRVELVDAERPRLGDGQVLVQVLACGVCGSDLNAWRGVQGVDYPLAPGQPGHEAWGVVAEVGADVPAGALRPGQRVTGLIQAGFAQYAVARADELSAVPTLPGDAPLLGEPLACAANIARRARVSAGDAVAVVGFGYLAALMMQLLFPTREGRWVAISRRPESRQLAQRLGAQATYDFDAVPSELWESFPVVAEAAGVQQTLDFATWLVAYGGRLVIAGYHADGPRTVNMQTWNWKGIDVINAHERKPGVYMQGLKEGLRLVEQHNLDTASLITHRWPLARVAAAFETADTRPPDYVKGIVLPWNE